MEIHQYFDLKKELYQILFKYIDDPEPDDAYFKQLIEFLQNHEIINTKAEFKHFLTLLLIISNNNNRNQKLIDKIELLLAFFSNDIRQTFSNFGIFKMFHTNKRILLFLINNEIVIIDDSVLKMIMTTKESNGVDLYLFFLPEIKAHISEEQKQKIESQICKEYPDILDNYEKKRQIGENDSYICELIRQDSAYEFIKFINKNDLSCNNKVKKSVFETNSFLIKNHPNLIEYAVFFGSIKIFNYLMHSSKESYKSLSNNLWMFAIHSFNANMIHLLEEYQIKPAGESFENCYLEAIKLHYNSFADYLINNYLSDKDLFEKTLDAVLASHNYLYLPENLCQSPVFYYSYKNEYFKAVTIYFDIKASEILEFAICEHNFISSFY